MPKFELTGNDAAELRRLREKLDGLRFVGMGGYNGPNQIVVGPPAVPQGPAIGGDIPPSAVIRITAYDAANGYYQGYKQKRKNSGFSAGAPSDFSDDVDLKMSDYYVDSGSTVVVINDAESAVPLRALRADGTEYVECVPSGSASDALDPLPTPCFRCNVPFKSMVCRIDHTGSGDGVYTGVVLFGGCSLAVTADAAEVASTMTAATVQAILVHIPEMPGSGNGPNSAVGHRLPTSCYVTGTFLDMSSDATPVPVIAITGVIGRINTPVDLAIGTFPDDMSGHPTGTWTPDTTTWDWAINGAPAKMHVVTTVAYDGGPNASGSAAVTAGGSHKLVFPTRRPVWNAMGGLNNVDAEPSLGSLIFINLKPVSVGVSSIDGSGNLIWTPQTIYVIDFDDPESPTTLAENCT